MTANLFDHHRKFLEDRAISAEVIAARGYSSTTLTDWLHDEGFSHQVSKLIPGLVIPVRDAHGEVRYHQYRPDKPRNLDGKPAKYELPRGTRLVIDVPPQVTGKLAGPASPLWITEGPLKADAGVSAGLVCAGIFGVFGWRGRNSRGGKTALPDWEFIALEGREVYLVPDSDVLTNRDVADAVTRLGRMLGSRGADVRYVSLPPAADGGKVGLDDWLADHGPDINGLLVLADDEPPARPEVTVAAAPADPAVLLYGAGERASLRPPDFSGDATPQVHEAYTKWFGSEYDTGALNVILSAARAERLAGDPPWVINVAGSGCTKTETVTPLAAAGARIVSMLSGEAALLSATPADRRAKESTGGLLREIGSHGLLVIKDFTSVLSMHRDSRAKVISALREIHDGYWVRDVGTDGGLKISWAGRIVIIAACTTAWDAHREVVASMGDRFLVVRQRIDRRKAGEKAISNVGSERVMREEIGAAVRDALAAPLTPDPPEVEDTASLLALADLVTRCRTPVERDYQGNPSWAHDLEAPTRFAKQLVQLARGGLSLGMTQDAARAVAARAARDSMPPAYLKVLGDVTGNPLSRTAEVAQRLGIPWRTADRALAELQLLGCLQCGTDHHDKYVYTLNDSLADLVESIARKVRSPEKEEPE